MQIHLSGQEKFGILATELRGPANKTMRAELNKALRTAVKPAVDEVKAKIRSLPVTGSAGGGRAQRATKSGRHRGLRAAVAGGVRTKIDYGRPDIRIVVQPALPADQHNLPRDLNLRGGWRHPVFGHRDRWVSQSGQPYFEVTILQHRPQILTALNGALDATAKSIASKVH